MFKKNKCSKKQIEKEKNNFLNQLIPNKKLKYNNEIEEFDSINNCTTKFKKNNFFSKRNKKNIDELDKKEINDISYNKKERTFKQNFYLFSFLGFLIMLLTCVIIFIFINFKIENIDISSTQINKKETVENNESKNNELDIKKVSIKDINYFDNIRKIRDTNYYNNKNTIEEEIKNIEKENNDAKSETNTKGNDNISKTNSLPKNLSIQPIILKTNSLLEVSLKNVTNKCGGLEFLDIPTNKISKLNLALTSKGTSLEQSKLYTLNPDIYSSKMGDFNIKDFAVVTNGILLGEIIYIGNDFEGLKDEDDSYWFGYNLYTK